MMLPNPQQLDPASAMLNEQQVAEHIGLTVHALQRWRVKGGGPPFSKLGSAVRYRLSDVDQWIAANRVHSTSECGGR